MKLVRENFIVISKLIHYYMFLFVLENLIFSIEGTSLEVLLNENLQDCSVIRWHQNVHGLFQIQFLV